MIPLRFNYHFSPFTGFFVTIQFGLRRLLVTCYEQNSSSTTRFSVLALFCHLLQGVDNICILRTAYYPLLTIHCLLHTANCSLLTAYFA